MRRSAKDRQVNCELLHTHSVSHEQIFQRASIIDLSQSEIAKPDRGGRAAGKQMFEPLHHPHHPEVMRLAPALIALKNARIAHLTTGIETCVELSLRQ